MSKKPTTIHLGDEDRESIKTIREKYNLSTDADAIRLALTLTANDKKRNVTYELRRKKGETEQENS